MSETPSVLSATSATHDVALAQRVLDARVEALYQRSGLATRVGLLFTLLMFVGLLPYAPTGLLWVWLGMRLTTALLRLVLRRVYQRRVQREGRVWLRNFVLALALDGFTWGLAACWLVLWGQTAQFALAMVALVGVASVGMFVMQSSWRASSVFVASMLLPTALLLLLKGGRASWFGGAGILIYVGLMALEARRAERAACELLALRFSTDRIAQEREEALILAQRQSAVKGQFLATMSHEMRTPLHGILGLTRQMQQRAGAEPQLALVEKAGEHLLQLINDALDFSKLEAGQIQLDSQVFDLAVLIDDVLSLLRPTAYQSGLTLAARMHMPRPCWVRGDPSRLRQVLHNLVGNAIKFTEAGGVTVVAKHNAERGRARIAVHDTGVGIAQQDLARIFEAFHQADSSFARRFGGTGLGLTIARDLARAMGGDLVCTSQLGRGSCFTVTLDLPVVSDGAAAPDRQGHDGDEALEAALGAPLPPLKGRVLLAEDNPVNAIVAEAVLLQMGLSVQLVGDGEQALRVFQERRPDLVLLDCQMPVMDGLEAARRMRAHEVAKGWPHTPLIALTANALAGDREQSLAAGMDDHLAKPFRDEALRALLARYLQAE